MGGGIVPSGTGQGLATAAGGAGLRVPALIGRAGQRAPKRFIEFFVAQYRNPNTREAYARAVGQFLAWSEEHGLRDLDYIEPLHVAAYIEECPVPHSG